MTLDYSSFESFEKNEFFEVKKLLDRFDLGPASKSGCEVITQKAKFRSIVCGSKIQKDRNNLEGR